MNLANNLKNTAQYFPDSIALIEGERRLTYRDLDSESSKIASALSNDGVKPGDHVALLYPNSMEWIAFYFGVLKAGAVAVTLPYAMTEKELNPVLADCRPKAILTNDIKLSSFDRTENIKIVIAESADFDYQQFVSKGFSDFELIERDPDDTAAVLYTGGTTGLPKGVMLTHRNIIFASFNVAYNERSSEKDRAVCFLPLNHVFGQIHIMNSIIYAAGGLVLQPSFDMDAFLGAVQEHHITNIYAVPTVYTRLLSLPDLKERMSGVRYCFSAAASMASELVKEWKQKTGLDIFESYGMTESASMTTYNHYYRHVVGSVGTPVSGVEIQIRDEKGGILEKNQRGEICIAAPNIMKGYLNRPEDTKKAFWGRWFRSGDVGILDDKGYLFIVDRIKDLIITGGENVAPREIEDVLYERHEVEECAVIGLPDKEYGERVVAYIIPRKNREIDPVELKAYLKKHLSSFKVPKQFITVPALPKSSAGKLLKRTLKEQVLDGTIEGI